jgi:GNAT superfamily N-acetyltransferase
MQTIDTPRGPITLRTDLRPGNLGSVVNLHGVLYAQERGFDPTFEAYVGGTLFEFMLSGNDRQRLWIAECDGQIVGCIAVVAVSARTAQIRWFLVDPCIRGLGLGQRLLGEAVTFCKGFEYSEVILWTESALTVAAHLYRSAGLCKTEEKPGRMWGMDLVEEKYELRLR